MGNINFEGQEELKRCVWFSVAIYQLDCIKRYPDCVTDHVDALLWYNNTQDIIWNCNVEHDLLSSLHQTGKVLWLEYRFYWSFQHL